MCAVCRVKFNLDLRPQALSAVRSDLIRSPVMVGAEQLFPFEASFCPKLPILPFDLNVWPQMTFEVGFDLPPPPLTPD